MPEIVHSKLNMAYSQFTDITIPVKYTKGRDNAIQNISQLEERVLLHRDFGDKSTSI